MNRTCHLCDHRNVQNLGSSLHDIGPVGRRRLQAMPSSSWRWLLPLYRHSCDLRALILQRRTSAALGGPQWLLWDLVWTGTSSPPKSSTLLAEITDGSKATHRKNAFLVIKAKNNVSHYWKLNHFADMHNDLLSFDLRASPPIRYKGRELSLSCPFSLPNLKYLSPPGSVSGKVKIIQTWPNVRYNGPNGDPNLSIPLQSRVYSDFILYWQWLF